MFVAILPTPWTWLQVIFLLFIHLKQFLGNMHMGNNEEVKKRWLGTGLVDWQQISTIQAYGNLSHDMTST
jgi:hypothetical protein